ncbi:vWA domain-containing protein [Psychromonas arctica]|uniref:vWA domain-containing protein n=1 Tax=Psychromonas arctica TaxID=168275 RepID=UPI002FD5AC26
MNFNDTLDSSFGALEFLRPYWLIGLVIIFALSLWRYKQGKNQSSNVIANHLSEHLVTQPETKTSNRFALSLLAVIACIALSGPSIRSVKLPVYEIQKAQVIAFDLSYSMYATDVKPNRLNQAKYKAIDLLKQWTEGDKGFIAYAGDAFTITPLTKDSNSIINHIPNLSPDLMPARGSRPDLALAKAITLLKNAGYQQGHIVFISDGIDQESADKMQAMIEGTDFMVSILAVGTAEGAPIKLRDGSLLKDSSEKIIIPKLDTDAMYAVTQNSNGLYKTFDHTGNDILQLAAHYNNEQLNKQQDEQANNSNSEQLIDDGYWLSFLLIPLFLLLFRKGVFYVALLSFTLSLPFANTKVEASVWENSQQNAYQAFKAGNYKSAGEQFEDPSWKASALFKDKQYQQAEAIYKNQKEKMPNDTNNLYNLGNAQAMQQKYKQALASYNAALAIKPDFAEALANKKAVEDLLKQQDQQENQQDQQSSDQQQQNQQDQQSSDQQQKNQQQSQQDQQSSDQQQQNQQQSQQEQQSSDQQQQNQQQSQQEQQSSDQNQQQSQQDQQSPDQQQQNQQQSQQDQQSPDQQQQSQQQSQQEQQYSDQQQQETDEEQQRQQAQQNSAEAEENEQTPEQQAAAASASQDPEVNQEYEDLPLWLKNVPDDPSLLLKNKMQLEYKKRAANQPVLNNNNNNGEIW